MHDECIVGENIPPSGPRGAKAEIVLLAIAQAERHVERADRVDQCAADKHAKSDAGRQIRIGGYCSAGKRGADGFRIVAEAPGIVGAEPRERADFGVVRERRYRSDARVASCAAAQRLEPPGGDDGVRVEQHDIGTRAGHAAVRCPRESEIALVDQQFDFRKRASAKLVEINADPGVDRRVVDQRDPAIAMIVRKHALHAASNVVRRVVDRHDDVDEGIIDARIHSPLIRFHSSLTRRNGRRTHQRALCRYAMMRSCAPIARSSRRRSSSSA